MEFQRVEHRGKMLTFIAQVLTLITCCRAFSVSINNCKQDNMFLSCSGSLTTSLVNSSAIILEYNCKARGTFHLDECLKADSSKCHLKKTSYPDVFTFMLELQEREAVNNVQVILSILNNSSESNLYKFNKKDNDGNAGVHLIFSIPTLLLYLCFFLQAIF